MRYLSCLLLLSLLTGCLGGVKTKPALAVYDFGLEPGTEATTAEGTKIVVDKITASQHLNSNRMRYRLNYQNPAQVFTYTESRWAAQPVEMLSAKSRVMANTSTDRSNCALQLQLESFDHVFDSPTASFGVIQLSAALMDKKTRSTLAHTQILEKAAATSANAQGGVSALNHASTTALAKALSWGNTTAATIESCR